MNIDVSSREDLEVKKQNAKKTKNAENHAKEQRNAENRVKQNAKQNVKPRNVKENAEKAPENAAN